MKTKIRFKLDGYNTKTKFSDHWVEEMYIENFSENALTGPFGRHDPSMGLPPHPEETAESIQRGYKQAARLATNQMLSKVFGKTVDKTTDPVLPPPPPLPAKPKIRIRVRAGRAPRPVN